MATIASFIGELRFAWPLVFLLLPLPWLLAWWRNRRAPQATSGAIALPFADSLPAAAAPALRATGRRLDCAVLLVFVFLLLAAARPQWIAAADQRPASGRDLLLLLDVSASMQTPDLRTAATPLPRLAAATRFGRAFLERRPGDRVGLIVFASRPYLYVPLTYDLAAVGAALDGVAVGLAGEQTALGDALALAVKTLGQEGEAAPAGAVAVLISDGANTAGALSPQQAAWLASQRGVRVHALGLGASPDEAALRAMADSSGGSYARATDLAGVRDFFVRLDALEPVARSADPAVTARELYLIPLALAALVLFVRIAFPVLIGVAPPWRSGRAGGIAAKVDSVP
jgi:Ca-activated chloride channel family protein